MNKFRHPVRPLLCLIVTLLISVSVARSTGPLNPICSIKTADGSVLVGSIQPKTIKIQSSYGDVEVDSSDIVSYNDGFLTLRDGSKLKGNFPSDNISFKTARGTITLPLKLISSIAESPDEGGHSANTPAQAPQTSSSVSGAVLNGKVFDCFGKPLPGVSIEVQNTRFATTTDENGNYNLGYVPGKITIAFKKTGYYASYLTLDIATATTYPVQDLSLLKVLPSKGIFLYGSDDYLASANSLKISEANQQGNNLFRNANAPHQIEYYVIGQPVTVRYSDKDVKFVTDAPRSLVLGPVEIVLFRVAPNGLFCRQSIAQTGFGGDSTEEGERLKMGSISDFGDFRIWSGHLPPGSYVLTMETVGLGEQKGFIDPCFYFEILEKSATSDLQGTDNKASTNDVNKSLPPPSFDAHAQFEFAVASFTKELENLPLKNGQIQALTSPLATWTVAKTEPQIREALSRSTNLRGIRLGIAQESHPAGDTTLFDLRPKTLLGGYVEGAMYHLLVQVHKSSETNRNVYAKLIIGTSVNIDDWERALNEQFNQFRSSFSKQLDR